MNKTITVFILTAMAIASITVCSAQTDTIHQVYRSRGAGTIDTLLVNGGRSMIAGVDINKNGKKEIYVTSYNHHSVVMLEVAGNDTLEVIQEFPAPASSSYSSEPRSVQVGDLDHDGNLEVIYPVGRIETELSRGYNVWEWSPDSNKFVGPYILLPDPPPTYFRPENFLVADIDSDGVDELIDFGFGFSGGEDKIHISSVSGTFESGFYTLADEFSFSTSTLTDGKDFATVTGIIADADGNGKNELWVFGNNTIGTNTVVTNIQCTGADTYVAPNDAQIVVMEANNNYPLKTVATADYDNNGKDEIYFPFFATDIIYAIVNVSDASNFSASNIVPIYMFDTSSATVDTNPLHATKQSPYGLRSWGRQNSPIYVAGYYAIDEFSYKGGPVDNPSSYKMRLLWQADSLEYALGAGITGGMWYTGNTPGSDLDGDNKAEILASFQGIGSTQTNDTSGHKPLRMWEFTHSLLGVKNLTIITPDDYTLNQNYPNPFNPTTTITFTIPLNKQVTATVYDMLGREVKTLVNNEMLSKGEHSLVWNSTNNAGKLVASGSYIFRLTAGNVVKTMKMMLVK